MSETVPNRIREAREIRGLTQAELARRLGIAQTVLRRLETGERPLNTRMLGRISAMLCCNPRELLAAVDAPRTPLTPNESLPSKDEKLLVDFYRGLDIREKFELVTLIEQRWPEFCDIARVPPIGDKRRRTSRLTKSVSKPLDRQSAL